MAQELIPCPDGSMADPAIGCVSVPGHLVQPESDMVLLLLNSAGGLMWIVSALAVFTMIYGGIRYMTAAGEEEKIDQAKRILFWGGVGLVVALLARYMVNLVVNFI